MMEAEIFLALVGLFFVWLLVKDLTKSQTWPSCAVCAATTTTWLGLLALRAAGVYQNDSVLTLLLGASVTGGYYWLASHKRLAFFKLPIFLSLLVGAYLFAIWRVSWSLLLLVGVVWALFLGLGFGRRSAGLVKKIIECCKNW